MLYNDIKNAFNGINLTLTTDIIINSIYREFDRKPDTNFIYFKEENRTIENGCTTSITLEISSVFENELLSIRCRDMIIDKIKNDNLLFSLGNESIIYTSGVLEYNKTLYIAPFSVTINLLN